MIKITEDYLYKTESFEEALEKSEKLNQKYYLVDVNSGAVWLYVSNKPLVREELVLYELNDWSDEYSWLKGKIHYYVVSDTGDIGMCYTNNDGDEVMDWILMAEYNESDEYKDSLVDYEHTALPFWV